MNSDFKQRFIVVVKNSIDLDLLDDITISILWVDRSKSVFGKSNAITIFIVCNEDSVVDYRIDFSDGIFLNHIGFVQEEASKRGLDFSSEKMRLKILDDLRSVSIVDYSVQTIVDFINCILHFNLISKHVLTHLSLPKSIWYSKANDYDYFDKKFRIHPIVAGFFDANIDEIVLLDKALFGLLCIYFTDHYHDKLINTFINSEGYINFMNDDYVIQDWGDEELRMHFSVQTMTSVSFLLK